MRRIGGRLIGAVVTGALFSSCTAVRERLESMGFEIAPVPGVTQLAGAVAGCSDEEKRSYEMGAEREYFFGRAIGARMLGDLGAEPLPRDHAVARYVDQVGQLLAISAAVQGEATVADRAEHPLSARIADRPWPLTGYHFVVLPLEEPNAFGSPGGLVTVTTGLLRQLKNEEELAGVLAHEIVHVHRGHGVEMMKAHLCQSEAQGRVAQSAKEHVSGAVAGMSGGAFEGLSSAELGGLLETAMKGVLGVFSHGYPKALELEADRMAVRLLASAGYSPEAFDALLFRMKKAADGKDKYLDTHPPFEDRLRAVRPAIARLPKEAQKRPSDEVALRSARFEAAMASLRQAKSAAR